MKTLNFVLNKLSEYNNEGLSINNIDKVFISWGLRDLMVLR